MRTAAEMAKKGWPSNPKDGDVYIYTDPIGGASFVYFTFFMGTWQYWKTE